MENVVLTIHLILAVLLTGVVLLQRSEGGGLGMGGGGGGGGLMTGRQAANAMTRLTWIFGIALFVTSVALTVIAARQTSTGSIMDQLGMPAQQSESSSPAIPTYTPPPTTGGDPLTPPSPEAANGAAQTPAPEAPEAEAITPPAAETQPEPAPAAEPADAETPATPPAQSGN